MNTRALPVIVRRVLDAANAGQSDEFLACFAAEGAVNDWGRVFRGYEAIRAWSDAEFIGVQVTLALTGFTVHGDGVTIAAVVGGNGFNGPSHFSFTLVGERIAMMRITG